MKMFKDAITRFDTLVHERNRQQDSKTDGRTDGRTLDDDIGCAYA